MLGRHMKNEDSQTLGASRESRVTWSVSFGATWNGTTSLHTWVRKHLGHAVPEPALTRCAGQDRKARALRARGVSVPRCVEK